MRVGRSACDRRGFFQSARAEVIVWLFATWHSTGENNDGLERKRAQASLGVPETSLIHMWSLLPIVAEFSSCMVSMPFGSDRHLGNYARKRSLVLGLGQPCTMQLRQFLEYSATTRKQRPTRYERRPGHALDRLCPLALQLVTVFACGVSGRE